MPKTAQPKIPTTCPCCLARTLTTTAGDQVWWRWHCTGDGRVKCGWLSCATCRARISLTTGLHITADLSTKHRTACRNPHNLVGGGQ